MLFQDGICVYCVCTVKFGKYDLNMWPAKKPCHIFAKSSHVDDIFQNITTSMQMYTDTILKKHRSLGILSYVFLLFDDRDKSNIVDETNVDTWGTWTGNLYEFGAYVRHCCGTQNLKNMIPHIHENSCKILLFHWQ